MTSTFSILSISALTTAFLLPLALVWRRPAAGTPVAIGYGILVSTLASYHVGLFGAPALPDLDRPEVARASLPDGKCAELIELLESNRVIVDRSEPPRLVVADPAWSTLPEVAKASVAECVQRAWPAGADPAQIKIQAQ
jgi:hypothetical protein